MTEGYVILQVTQENIKQAELLACTIHAQDSTRPIAIITNDYDIEKVEFVDKIVYLDKNSAPNNELEYFKNCLSSPYLQSICFTVNQLLTSFNPIVWENLKGMGPVVFPKTRYSFSYETIEDKAYWKNSLEEKTFGFSSIIDAVYLDKETGSDDILGLAIDIAGLYKQEEYLTWLQEFKKNTDDVMLPVFPEYLWPSWIVSYIATITENKIKFVDFVKYVDLKKQENNFWNKIWSEQSWNKFLSYWVNEQSQLKIENFIQLGLISYSEPNWLDEKIIKHIKNVSNV